MAEEKKVVVKVIGDTSDLTKKLSKLKKDLKNFASTIDKVDDNAFDKINKNAENLKDKINEVDRAVDNLKDDISEVDDDKSLNKLGRVGEDTKESIDKLKRSFNELTPAMDTSQVNKNLNNSKESMRELGENVDKTSIKLEDMNEEAKESVGVFNRLDESTSDIGNKIKTGFNSAGDSINNTVSKATKGMGGLVNTTANVATALGTNKELLSRWKNAWGNAGKAIEKSKNLTNAMDKSIDKATDSISKGTKIIDENSEAYKRYSRTVRGAKKENEEVAESFEEVGEETTKLGKKIEDLIKKLMSFSSEKLTNLFSGLSDSIKKLKDGDIDGAFNSLKFAFSGLSGKAVAVLASVVALGAGLKKLYDIGKQRFFTGLEDMKNKFQPLVNLGKRAGYEIKTAFENLSGMRVDLSSFIETVVNFEDSIVRVGAIAGASEEQFDKLSDVAREFGATTRFSASQASDAMQNLAMAGWSVEEMIDGLGATLNLAIIAEMSLADASTFVSDGLASLGMSAKQTSDFVDMLSATATNSNTSVSQLQGAFTNVAPIAGTLGVTMSDLSVALGLMANQGVKAEKSGTALKNLLTNLSSPSEKMTKVIEKYNLGTAQTLITNGKLVEGIKEMQKQLDGLTAKEKTAIISTIAGKYALSGVSALMNSSTSDINELKFAVDSSTKSSRLYAQTLGLVDKNGKMVASSFEEMKDKQGNAYKTWKNFNEVMNETADVMTYVGGSTTDLGAIVQKLGEDHEVTADQVNDILNVFDKLRDGSDKSAKVMKNYGVQLAYTEEGSLNFGQTLKNVGKVWDDLSNKEKKAMLSQLGYKGSVEEMNELFDDNGDKVEDLIDTYEKAQGVSEHMAKTFDSTLKGSIFNLSSAIEERLLQVFDKFKEGIQSVTDTLKTFFNIWNGLDEGGNGSGLGDALAFLADKAKGWGEAIKNGIVNAINGLDDFINSGSFDSLLSIGTSIIQGICDGIHQAKENGSLDSAIDGFIKKICQWVEDNSDGIVQAGKDITDSISKGIENNKTALSSACDKIYEVINTWVSSNDALIGQLGATVGWSLIKGCVIGIGQGIGNMFSAMNDWFGNTMVYAVQLVGQNAPRLWDIGVNIVNGIGEGIANGVNFIMDGIDKVVKSIIDWFKEKLGIHSPSTVMKDEVGAMIMEGLAQGILDGITNISKAIGKVVETVVDGFKGIWDKITGNDDKELVNIDTAKLEKSRLALEKLGNTADTVTGKVRTAFVSMSNVIRNQMVNCSNIVRNQATSWSNVIRNQSMNARNYATSAFISMKKVISTQLTESRTYVVSKMMSIAKVINTQAWKGRDNATRAFISLAKVVNTQMFNAYQSVNNYMAKIRNATNRQMTMKFKVDRTITTTNVTKDVQQGMRATMGRISANMATVGSPSTQAIGGSSSGNLAMASGGGAVYEFSIPVVVDGKEIARASASYTEAELAKRSKRRNRKRGE